MSFNSITSDVPFFLDNTCYQEKSQKKKETCLFGEKEKRGHVSLEKKRKREKEKLQQA